MRQTRQYSMHEQGVWLVLAPSFEAVARVTASLAGACLQCQRKTPMREDARFGFPPTAVPSSASGPLASAPFPKQRHHSPRANAWHWRTRCVAPPPAARPRRRARASSRRPLSLLPISLSVCVPARFMRALCASCVPAALRALRQHRRTHCLLGCR